MRRDDFEAWLKDPVTVWVMRAVERAQKQEKAEWVRQSWEAGVADQSSLLELKTRADALGDLIDNTFEDWENWNSDD